MDLLSKIRKENDRRIISEFLNSISSSDMTVLKNYLNGVSINSIAMMLGESPDEIRYLIEELEEVLDYVKRDYESESMYKMFFSSANFG